MTSQKDPTSRFWNTLALVSLSASIFLLSVVGVETPSVRLGQSSGRGHPQGRGAGGLAGARRDIVEGWSVNSKKAGGKRGVGGTHGREAERSPGRGEEVNGGRGDEPAVVLSAQSLQRGRARAERARLAQTESKSLSVGHPGNFP